MKTSLKIVHYMVCTLAFACCLNVNASDLSATPTIKEFDYRANPDNGRVGEIETSCSYDSKKNECTVCEGDSKLNSAPCETTASYSASNCLAHCDLKPETEDICEYQTDLGYCYAWVIVGYDDAGDPIYDPIGTTTTSGADCASHCASVGID